MDPPGDVSSELDEITRRHILVIKCFFYYHGIINRIQQRIGEVIGRDAVPHKKTITRIVENFENSALIGTKKTDRPRTINTLDNREQVREFYEENPTTSQRSAARQLEISRSSLQRIMNELKLHPYKIQQFQDLTQWDMDRRLRFANAFRQAASRGQINADKIWFSDEAHFHLRGYINKQNYRHWGSENPRIFRTSTHTPQRITVWCAISSKGIIGPWFFTENVNRISYREVLEKKFIPEAQGLEAYDDFWFQQDGATPHTTNENLDLLDEHFHGKVIARRYEERFNCGLEWPPNSPDLNPCDYYLWGKLKDLVFATEPGTLAELKTRMQEEIKNINVGELKRTIRNFGARVDKVYEVNGAHIEHYHM